jgi:hypothetical protein
MSARAPLPGRYPPTGAWPEVMRADMAAAYLDYRDTSELARGIRRGEAPPPIGHHGIGRTREPIRSKTGIDKFIEPDSDGPRKQDLASLV